MFLDLGGSFIIFLLFCRLENGISKPKYIQALRRRCGVHEIIVPQTDKKSFCHSNLFF